MRRGRPPYPDVLTPREQEVLTLIREGLTNDQIAARLGISESGARYHDSEILSKLGVESRYEAARWSALERPRKLPILTWLRLGGTGMLVAVAVAGVGLALGVIVMRDRSGANSTNDFNEQTNERSLASFLNLASEAYSEARTSMPTAMLFQVDYSLSTDLFTFKFTEPTPMHEAQVIGPNTSTGQQRWLHTQSSFANLEGAELRPLDLARLDWSPVDIGDAVARKRQVSSVILFSGDDGPRWGVAGSEGGGVLCGLPDGAPLSEISCP